MLATTHAHLTARIARAQADGRLPSLAAGVLDDGRLAWSGGRGRVGGAAPTADTQYRIGSITKTVTAVLVLRLRHAGRLRLDDPVERHLPGVALGGRTVGQLLGHAGGLRAEPEGSWWERSPGVDWPTLAATLGERSLLFPAGRRFHYSNLGYAVLGRLVAELRGRDWADCVEREVLAPLEMRRTGTAPLAHTGPAAPSARGYAVHPSADLLLDEQVQGTGAMAPAGELWSTVADLARLGALLLGDAPDVLDPATVEEMRAPGVADTEREPWAAFGLGVRLTRERGRLLVGHGGSMPGFLAGLLVDPQRRRGAVVLANATTGLDPALAPDLLALLDTWEPWVAPEWSPLADPPEAGVLDLLGTWFWGTAGHEVSLGADGLLELCPTGQRGRADRFRRTGDGWVGLSGYYAGEVLRGVRDAGGALTHLDVGTFVLTREPYPVGAVTPGGVPEPGWRAARPGD